MRITELFTAKSIELDSAASNRDEILSRLVVLQATHGNITDTEAYKKALYAREDEASTYVDNGITVPHAKTNVVTRPSLAALRLSTPVQYNAEDDGKTDLLFAIAAPENGSLHVDMLARMMQMLMNEDFVEKLKAARTPAEFLALIDAQEEAQFGEESFTQQAIPQSGYRILAVTACPNGIAHTYMAAEALAKAGDKLGLPTISLLCTPYALREKKNQRIFVHIKCSAIQTTFLARKYGLQAADFQDDAVWGVIWLADK